MTLTTALDLIGAALIVAGVAWFSIGVALVVAGLLVIAISFDLSGRARRSDR